MITIVQDDEDAKALIKLLLLIQDQQDGDDKALAFDVVMSFAFNRSTTSAAQYHAFINQIKANMTAEAKKQRRK
jgi:hypothetical protein